LRSRALTWIAVGATTVGMAGGAGAQQPAAPPRQQQPAPYNGQSQPYYYPPAQPYPGQPQQQAPAGSTVQQRSDRETPRLHFRPPPPEAAPADGKARPTVIEAASSQSAAGRAPNEPPVSRRPAAPVPSHIEELIQRSQGTIDFYELVDDILDEIARQLAREDPNLVSPMAIKFVRLSPNLSPEFGGTLQSRLVARLTNATNVKVAMCPECTALRSRVEDGNWILTVGTVSAEELRRIGVKTGVKTFMEVDFTYSPNSNIVWMSAVVYRASDGGVVWSDAYRSDATMTALLRTGRKIPTRAERAAELDQKLNQRPFYGYALSLGVAQMGYSGRTGDIAGAQASLRFHEKFGEDLTSLFGMTAGIFTTGPPKEDKVPQALNSILLGAYYSYDLSPPNLNRPEVWVYGEGGGMFSGNEGNTFYLESGIDTHLKWRLSLQGGLMYVFHTKFSGSDLGGVGFRLRVGMNW